MPAATSRDAVRPVLFLLFFVSGFSGLVYQVVWTRLAFASFGIITPVLSVVISVFMLGLSVGSWLAGRIAGSWPRRTRASAILLYAAAELLIGVGAFAVPALFAVGERALLHLGETDSTGYLLGSAVVLGISILPWCVCMGATFPFMMAFVREWNRSFAASFSFLYLANVLGAMTGTLMAAVLLIEAFGLRHTLWVAAAGNILIVAISLGLARLGGTGRMASPAPAVRPAPAPAEAGRPVAITALLFLTGFCSMAMEVIWSRSFTPVVQTQVYSFAAVLFAYLGATALGSGLYRRDLGRGARRNPPALLALLSVAAFLPVVVNDPRLLRMSTMSEIHLPSVLGLLASIGPFCALLGYLTPQLVDRYAQGDPRAAGRAYAINVLGCIAGPLVASYGLLPLLPERAGLILLGAPFVAFAVFYRQGTPAWLGRAAGLSTAAILAVAVFVTKDFTAWVTASSATVRVRRDYAASAVAYGKGMDRQLLVNGVGMTKLTPITKFMVDLPLALLPRKPASALIICFGMGTTYRTAMSWGIDTTAVELVPGVRDLFDYYHPDAAQLLANPNGRIIIDDGRRFLRRVRTQYDVITIDPPPPIEAAGSSLLYSQEFMELAKQHLRPGGILQVWFPGGELETGLAIIRTVKDTFPHVVGFVSIERAGFHLLASTEPLTIPSAAVLASRLPESARADLLEWSGTTDAAAYFLEVISRPLPIGGTIRLDPAIRITDDHPFNEYFLIRRALRR